MRANLTLLVYCGLLLLALVRWAVEADTTACRVGYVYDGDSVELVCGDRIRPARIVGLDAPEATTPRCAAEALAAEAATQALRQMIRDAREVRVTEQGQDRYGRVLIRLRLDGRDAAQRMIGAGQARAYDGGARGGWC